MTEVLVRLQLVRLYRFNQAVEVGARFFAPGTVPLKSLFFQPLTNKISLINSHDNYPDTGGKSKNKT